MRFCYSLVSVWFVMVLALSQVSADLGATGRPGSIQRAAYDGDIAALRRLLARSPKLINSGIIDNDGILGTPLDIAAKAGRIEAMKFLIQRGANPHKSRPLGIAAYFHKTQSISFLLSQNPGKEQLAFAIMEALYGEDGSPLPTLRLLLKAGADPNAQDPTRSNRRALGLSSRHYDVDVVGALLEFGADVNAVDGDDMTALEDMLLGASMTAARTDPTASELARQQRVVDLLISKGARVNTLKSASHPEALSWAIQSRNPGLVRSMLEHGAKLNGPNSEPMATFKWFFERPINGQIKPLTPLLKQMKELLQSLQHTTNLHSGTIENPNSNRPA